MLRCCDIEMLWCCKIVASINISNGCCKVLSWETHLLTTYTHKHTMATCSINNNNNYNNTTTATHFLVTWKTGMNTNKSLVAPVRLLTSWLINCLRYNQPTRTTPHSFSDWTKTTCSFWTGLYSSLFLCSHISFFLLYFHTSLYQFISSILLNWYLVRSIHWKWTIFILSNQLTTFLVVNLSIFLKITKYF